MRYNLDSGLPVNLSQPEAVPGLKSPSQETKDVASFSMGLKRLKVYFGPQTTWWTKAYDNPFIHGSLLNWYRDECTYDRAVVAARRRDYPDAYPYPVTYEAVGNFVIKS
jgi:hypothetical protein